jgi:hypothetical protein
MISLLSFFGERELFFRRSGDGEAIEGEKTEEEILISVAKWVRYQY